MGTFTSRLRHAAPLVLVIAAAGLPADAHAGLLSRCPAPAVSQVFLPWADPGWYALLPDGGFENGGEGWTLSGGAAVVDGNEPYSVRAPGDRSSLALAGAGATASSAPLCVGLEHPAMRLFVRNTGATSGALVVAAEFSDPVGTRRIVPVGRIYAGAAWRPSPVLLVPTNALPFGQAAVFHFMPDGGEWSIDDVYIDPYGKG